MNTIYVLAFVFAVGCLFGWCLETVYRRFAEMPKKWINPGFLLGPYLPIYGFGLTLLYIISSVGSKISLGNEFLKNLLIIFSIGLALTIIEYIAGIIFIKKMNKKLWDYSDRWANIDGIICPQFSLYWTLLGAFYYYVLHKYLIGTVAFVFDYREIYFCLGLFFGIFIIDIAYSIQIVNRIKYFLYKQKNRKDNEYKIKDRDDLL